MPRVLTGVAIWLAGTVAAACLAWLGVSLAGHDTAAPAAPRVPAATAAPRPSPTGPHGAGPARPSRSPRSSPPGSPPPVTVSPSRPAAAPSRAGTPRRYTLAGGRVTLLLTRNSARLLSAVPDAGFTVQNWSGPGWLRVDFSSGPRASSLIASWNGHPPSIVTTN